MIVLIDNYDSFSYNLYQLIGSVEPDVKVVRNDSYTVEEIEAMKPEAIILSPGPGKPCGFAPLKSAIRMKKCRPGSRPSPAGRPRSSSMRSTTATEF